MTVAGTILQTNGLNSPQLTALLLVVALATLVWGLERYRTTFSKTDLGIAFALFLGISVLALVPDVFAVIGDFFSIEQRPLAVALVANVTLTFLVLLLFARTRDNKMTILALTRSLAVEQLPETDNPSERSVFVVIPAYNEATQVADVVADLPETVDGYDVTPVVVSDGSTDGTRRAAAETRALVVEHPINQGQGGALQTGFRIAREHDADIVVSMDADGQHPADQLDELIAPITNNDADYVIGSRYLGTDRSNNGLTRQAGIRAFTAVINLVAKTDVTDCTNGYRAIRGSSLDELTLTEERFSAPELLIEARKKGLRITEVPVTIKQRATGESKKPQLGYAFGLARTILVTWLR